MAPVETMHANSYSNQCRRDAPERVKRELNAIKVALDETDSNHVNVLCYDTQIGLENQENRHLDEPTRDEEEEVMEAIESFMKDRIDQENVSGDGEETVSNDSESDYDVGCYDYDLEKELRAPEKIVVLEMETMSEIRERMNYIHSHLAEYHNILEDLANAKNEIKKLKLENARYKANQCFCRDKLLRTLSTHKKRIEIYERTKQCNRDMEKEMIDLKLSLAQCKSQEDWHKLRNKEIKAELDDFRHKHEEIMNQENSEKNVLSTEVANLQKRIQFLSKPKANMADNALHSFDCNNRDQSSCLRRLGFNFGSSPVLPEATKSDKINTKETKHQIFNLKRPQVMPQPKDSEDGIMRKSASMFGRSFISSQEFAPSDHHEKRVKSFGSSNPFKRLASCDENKSMEESVCASSISRDGDGSRKNASWAEIKPISTSMNPFLRGLSDSSDEGNSEFPNNIFNLRRKKEPQDVKACPGLSLLKRRGFWFGSGATLSGQETQVANKFDGISAIRKDAEAIGAVSRELSMKTTSYKVEESKKQNILCKVPSFALRDISKQVSDMSDLSTSQEMQESLKCLELNL